MSSTGFVIVGTGNEAQRSGTNAWSNETNITADDGSVASSASAGAINQKTWTLYGHNLGLSLPDGAVIKGIEARVEARAAASTLDFDDVVLRKADGTFTTTDRSDAATLTGTLTAYTYGSATDLWGETWTKADVEDADFGAGFAFLSNNATAVAEVDYIALNVHYDVEITPSTGLARMLGGAPTLELSVSPVVGISRALGSTPTVDLAWTPETGLARVQGNTPAVELAWTPQAGLMRMIGQEPAPAEETGGFWHKAGLASGSWGRAPTAP